MTNEEIEKALAMCAATTMDSILDGNCSKCPYYRKHFCENLVNKDALEYINRIKAQRDAIRKETAKEILQSLMRKTIQCDGDDEWTNGYNFGCGLTKRNILYLCDKYGAEVDEC